MGYQDVKITEAEASALFIDDQPKTATEVKKEVPEEIPKSEETTKSSEDVVKTEEVETDEPKITIDGEEYNMSDVRKWQEDSKNKHDWSKSNTEKAQEIAKLRKSIEPVINFVTKLREKGETLREIKEYLTDSMGEEFSEVIDAAIEFDSKEFPHPDSVELAKERSEKSNLLAEKAIEQQKKDLMKSQGISESKAQKVLDAAIKRYEDTGEAVSLELQYKDMEFDNLKEQVKTNKPAPTKVPDKGGGVKSIQQEEAKPAKGQYTSGTKAYEHIHHDESKHGPLFE